MVAGCGVAVGGWGVCVPGCRVGRGANGGVGVAMVGGGPVQGVLVEPLGPRPGWGEGGLVACVGVVGGARVDCHLVGGWLGGRGLAKATSVLASPMGGPSHRLVVLGMGVGTTLGGGKL